MKTLIQLKELGRVVGVIFLGILILADSSCSKPERPSVSLFEAAEQGNLDQLKRHLYWGCDVNAVNSDSQTPLGLAAKNGQVEVVKLLVSKGADATKAGALHYAAEERQVKVIEALLNSGVDINTRDSSGYTALHMVGKKKILPATLPGFVISREIQKDLSDQTIAANFLIAKGADVNARANDNSTPLHLAAINGQSGMCAFLVSHGAQVDARDDKNWTPLHYACLFPLPGTSESVRYLLGGGSDVNAKDNMGCTPLHLVVVGLGKDDLSALGGANSAEYNLLSSDRCRKTRMLLDRGANREARDNKGITPSQYAEILGKYDLLKLLQGG